MENKSRVCFCCNRTFLSNDFSYHHHECLIKLKEKLVLWWQNLDLRDKKIAMEVFESERNYFIDAGLWFENKKKE